jgi:protein-histidine pros-kinase
VRDFEKQRSGHLPPVYIIAVTAHALDGDRERCLSAGMNDYLTKPLHIAQLEAALDRAIRRRPAVEKSDVVLDPVCIAGLKELREPGQEDPLIELAELFNREADACVGRMESGLAQHDVNVTARAAHSLKGSANNLGAHRLATICGGLEHNAHASDWHNVGAQLQELKTQLERVRSSLKGEIQSG